MSPRRIAKALAGFGTVALAAILAVTVWVVHHRSSAASLSHLATVVPGSLLHARNFHWTQMKDNQSQWVLKAADASYSADKTTVTLKDAELSMTANDGKSLLLVAPAAYIKMVGNQVKRADLSGGIRVNYNEFVLTTDKATFLPDSDELAAPGLVTIEGNGISVSGIGLSGHPKERLFELQSQVNTRIEPRQNRAQPKVS